MRSIALLTLMILGTACYEGSYWVDFSVDGYADIPTGYQVGDTVTFVAKETRYNSGGVPSGPTSKESPDGYRWMSGDQSMLRFVGPGRAVMLKEGRTYFTAETDRATGSIGVFVTSRFESLRITPRTVTMLVGDTASVNVTAIDAAGVELKDHPGAYFHRLVLPDRTGKDMNQMVNAVVAVVPETFPRVVLRAVGPGESYLVITSGIYRTKLVADTVRVVVAR